jgi:hypothetical protein
MTRIDWKARVSPEQVYARAAGRRRINKERQVMVAGRRLRLLEELKLGGQNYYQLAGLFNVSTRSAGAARHELGEVFQVRWAAPDAALILPGKPCRLVRTPPVQNSDLLTE